MQMEIRFASWTRAGKFRVTFVRTIERTTFPLSRRGTDRWSVYRIIQLQKCERNREIFPKRKKIFLKKKKKKKFAEILNVPFFLKNETFSPRASISNPLQPPLLFVSKTWQLLLPVKGVKSASLRSSPTIARQETSDEKDAIRLNDRLTSVVPNNVHPYICVALSANFAIIYPAFGRWYMSNDLVKSVEQQTPRVKGGVD